MNIKDDSKQFWQEHEPLGKNQILILLGILSGIVADGNIEDNEVLFLSTWLAENKQLVNVWPVSIIKERILLILKDGIISQDEKNELLSLLQEISGNLFNKTGSPSPDTPLTHKILSVECPVIEGNLFCFTGTFLFGSRSACIKATVSHKGRATDSLTTSVDYLVVGSHTTRSWKFGSYGNKIDQAVSWQEQYGKPLIIDEPLWLKSLS